MNHCTMVSQACTDQLKLAIKFRQSSMIIIESYIVLDKHYSMTREENLLS